MFVVWRGRVLLHQHRKLGIWLPPGGHVEPAELPDEAAVREVREETGVSVELLGDVAITAPGPRQLVRPRGVQLEEIAPGHEHIDLVYLARPAEPYTGEIAGEEPGFGWYELDSALAVGLTPEMEAWVRLVLAEIG